MGSVWRQSGRFWIEYISGRGNIQQAALNAIKGFLAVNLFTVVPVRLYSLSVALQGTFAQGITGAGSGIGDLGAAILENMESTSLTEIAAAGHWGIGTNPLMLIFCIILMAYAVIKVFFANLKRGGILLIQIAVGSLYMFSIPRGYLHTSPSCSMASNLLIPVLGCCTFL